MPVINANGCDFYYQMEGRGPDIVFIHGEIHGLDYWEHQFAEFATDHRCFAYNRRGHAKTGWTDYGFSLVNQTRDLEKLVECVGIERPVIIALAFGTTVPRTMRSGIRETCADSCWGLGASCMMPCNILSAGSDIRRRPPLCSNAKAATAWWRCCANTAVSRSIGGSQWTTQSGRSRSNCAQPSRSEN